ncbi:MAG: hypothetical protein WAM73_14260, partial [Desulfobacterales bacterium]
MKSHIQNISRKTLATGSGWGRLLTFAFLCSIFIATALGQNVYAGAITITIPDGINKVNVINSSDATIFGCPPTCSQSYNGTVYFEAVATPGWIFSHWTGGPSDGTNTSPSASINLTPPDLLNVTATFVPVDYKITATAGA